MLYRVMGVSGSGKTEYIFDRLGEAFKKGKQCFLLVPEQQSVAYESELCNRFGDSCNMLCEVLNFERLPNRIAREYGGLADNHIDKGGACALLSLIAESLKGELKEYSALADDADFALSLFGLISKMKMSLVTPELLTDALKAGSFEDEAHLYSKLHDVSLIYAEYEKRVTENYSDPRDALTVLGERLKTTPFFENTTVFIDGYYTFTEQEYAIIKEIIAQSKDTYVSFTIDYTRSFFDENLKASERVLKLSKRGYEDIYLPDSKRSDSKSLAFIEKNLWRGGDVSCFLDDGSVKMISAKNRFDEAEAAASEILDYIRAGGRFGEITVLAGNTDAYSAIVDSVFSRAEIPCYMSSKEALASKPLFAFVLSALSVITEDFSLRSIKRYIKSGYTSLSVSESDALLSYASSWNLRGKAWYGEDEWTLDPEGYREGDLTERGAKMLRAANRARGEIVPALSALRDSLCRKGLTVSAGVRALYNHLVSMSADEKLRQNAEYMLKNGNREDSEREIQLWKILINIFDQLHAVCGGIAVTPKRLYSLFKLMCDCYSLGAIPPSADSVTFGDASLIRAGGSKLVIVLGVCDGEFPASVINGGFFDRDEAVVLEELGLRLADTMEKQLNTNRFFVYAAFSAPAKRLVLCCPASELNGGELRPSSAWLAIQKMLPEVKEYNFLSEDMLYSPESIGASFALFDDGGLKKDIQAALIKNAVPYFEKMPSVSDSESKITFKQNELLLSPSRFERYALCPFSFFGNYLLGLQEKKKNEFSMPEIGNFVHKILEQFMRYCVSTGVFLRPNEEERKRVIDDLAQKYFLDVIGSDAESDKRFMHTYRNMVKTIDFVAESLCDEFSESKFIPTGFEFKIGLRDADIPAIEYDANGKRVLLRGSIDRVDTYVSGGVKYVRVIDYKTYNKGFSADLVALGLDSQLLHYLFAYCEKEGAVPAGALYYTVVLPNVQINGRETPEQIKQLVEKSIKRSGILLNDPEVVFAMSRDCSFVPVRRKKDGTLSEYGKSKKLYTDDEFADLSQTLRSKVESLAEEVFCGNMDIAPNDADGKAEPCKYCSLSDFCRSKRQKEEDDDFDAQFHGETE